jgi:hypothetical protein
MNVFDKEGYIDTNNPDVVREASETARQIALLCDVPKLAARGATRFFIVHTSSSLFLAPGTLKDDRCAIYGFDVVGEGSKLRLHSVSASRGGQDTVYKVIVELNKCEGEARVAFPAKGTASTVAVYAIFPDNPRGQLT